MSKSNPGKAGDTGKPASKPQFAVIVVVAAVAVLLAVSLWPRNPSPVQPAPPAQPVESSNTASAPASTAAPADLQIVKGRWLRPDGGYMLEIRNVDDNGQLDAGYFNPDPIHVSSAVASKDGAATKVYIELNDVNYPGSKYNLTYIPDKDLLVGTYFQATLKQTFEVGFERLKE